MKQDTFWTDLGCVLLAFGNCLCYGALSFSAYVAIWIVANSAGFTVGLLVFRMWLVGRLTISSGDDK